MRLVNKGARLVVFVVVVAVGVVAGWLVFIEDPASMTELVGVVLLLVVALVTLRVAGNLASTLFPAYNVAEVAVEGEISRDQGGGLAQSPMGTSADDVEAETVRDTEARIYLGGKAQELGLIDHLGTREDVTDRLGTDVSVREFTPPRGLAARLQQSSARVAYALGTGLGDAVTGETTFRFR